MLKKPDNGLVTHGDVIRAVCYVPKAMLSGLSYVLMSVGCIVISVKQRDVIIRYWSWCWVKQKRHVFFSQKEGNSDGRFPLVRMMHCKFET
jgi:hypothetical protein